VFLSGGVMGGGEKGLVCTRVIGQRDQEHITPDYMNQRRDN
jgi:hypothetical protein